MPTTPAVPRHQTVFGFPVQRLEDEPLLRGTARFIADLEPPGTCHVAFVRSQVAHGRIVSVDTDAALSQPGVVGVYTAGDLDLPGLGEVPPLPTGPRPVLARPCLAGDRVRFVGEAIAAVVAESYAAAVDAAEHVIVDVADEPAVVDPLSALEPEAPLLFPDHGTNIVREETISTAEDALAGADVVVSARFVNQRVAAVPMEPNGTLAAPRDGGGLLCYASTQSPFQVRAGICRALGREPDEVQVVVPAVGGGFGAKGGVYPEQIVVAALADRLQRPVRHVETRSENLVAMSQGRGQVQDVEIGAKRDGTLVGLRVCTVTDFGAYAWRGGISFHTSTLMATGPYRVPQLELSAYGVVTNTSPTGPYRGAGRPEATAMLERAMDLLATELGIDPVELRRRNLIGTGELPLTTATGASYDSGDYAGALEHLVERAGYAALRADQEARRSAGDRVQLGIGVSVFVEVSGSGSEYGSVRIAPDGHAICTTGSSPHGQGHETTFAQIAADVLQMDIHDIEVVHSDTAVVPRGTGTFGSRSGQLGGGAVVTAGEIVVDRARRLAAELLEAAETDIVLADGRIGVSGVPTRSFSWAELAAHAATPVGVEVLGEDGLFAEDDFEQSRGTYPFGAHLAVVELDTETGKVTLRRLVAVDDCGNMVNPMVVAGQVQGGLLQGVAQALFEEMSVDELGNPQGTTLAEYGIPSAAEVPSFEVGHTVTPSPRNPLGMKGIGESGTVGATPAVQNAVLDALAPYGIAHLDMPLTSLKIWEALASSAGR
ncbi:MAG: xanthine dehydrogenase family protein molybdopterin-binding subunit [Actinomycetota bacterium]|nr:xanthine dehydrogenase family protein molybdopterin-binding subunit [Actinomycetota bacterium]